MKNRWITFGKILVKEILLHLLTCLTTKSRRYFIVNWCLNTEDVQMETYNFEFQCLICHVVVFFNIIFPLQVKHPWGKVNNGLRDFDKLQNFKAWRKVQQFVSFHIQKIFKYAYKVYQYYTRSLVNQFSVLSIQYLLCNWDLRQLN